MPCGLCGKVVQALLSADANVNATDEVLGYYGLWFRTQGIGSREEGMGTWGLYT